MEKPTITGKAEVTLPTLRSVPPSEAQSYFIAGGHLLNGVKALIGGPQDSLWSLSFLASQALECLLKAFLCSQGLSEKQLKEHTLRHNLEGLWKLAEKYGLGISSTAPDWCVSLNSSHNTPYKIRYPMGLNGMVFPNPANVAKGLARLCSVVEQKIEG